LSQTSCATSDVTVMNSLRRLQHTGYNTRATIRLPALALFVLCSSHVAVTWAISPTPSTGTTRNEADTPQGEY
jgi:hypothetical protein